MTDAAQVALIITAGSIIVAVIQKINHGKHEKVSTATNEAVNRLEIAVNGDLDQRIAAAVKEALSK